MPPIWDSHFGAVQAQGYAVVIGETGGYYGTRDPRDKTFQDALFAYLKQRDLRDVFYWSWNPNSGDTGGILNDDWTTVRQDKVTLLQNFWAGAPNPPATTTPPAPSACTRAACGTGRSSAGGRGACGRASHSSPPRGSRWRWRARGPTRCCAATGGIGRTPGCAGCRGSSVQVD